MPRRKVAGTAGDVQAPDVGERATKKDESRLGRERFLRFRKESTGLRKGLRLTDRFDCETCLDQSVDRGM